MAHLSAVPIVLGDEERRALEGLMRGHTTPQQMALRARMILHCDDGVGVREIARRLGVWPKTVCRWHKRWLSSAPGVAVAARLSDAPKSGAPAKVGAEQICAIIAIACEPPSASDRPITQWLQQEVADEAMRRGIVDSISQRSVGRFFKRDRPGSCRVQSLSWAQETQHRALARARPERRRGPGYLESFERRARGDRHDVSTALSNRAARRGGLAHALGRP